MLDRLLDWSVRAPWWAALGALLGACAVLCALAFGAAAGYEALRPCDRSHSSRCVVWCSVGTKPVTMFPCAHVDCDVCDARRWYWEPTQKGPASE